MQLSASLNSSHHLSTQPFTEMEGLNLWSFNLAQVRMGQLLFIMRPQHSYSNNAMQRLKDWIDRLLSYILKILLNISVTTFVIFWDRCTAIKTNLVDIGKWPCIQRSPFQQISSTLKQHLNENIGSWRKSFPFLLPLSWPSYIFVERLWPSRIASPTSCASSHLMACRVSDSSRSNRSATLVKRGWKRRWHILFTLDS